MKRKNCISLYCSRWVLFSILIPVALFLCSGGILQATTTTGDLNADISVKGRPLKEVVNLVQEQTGYRVELQSIDDSVLVTGNFRQVAVDKIFTHLLKGYNISVATNPTEKLISLISLGRNIQLADNAQYIESVPLEATDVAEPESDSSTQSDGDTASIAEVASEQSPEPADLSDQDVQKLHAQQMREFEQQQNNPGAIDSLTGMAPKALEDMHNKQIRESNLSVK